MKRVIVQVPMSEELKKKAEAAAREQGFSSLQETIRVLLTKLSQKKLHVNIAQEEPEYVELSPRAEKRYKKALEDIKAGRNIYKPKDVDELMAWLHK